MFGKRNRIEVKCLLCGHVTPFKSLDEIDLATLEVPHGCTATPAEREDFQRRLAEPGSTPDLIECPSCSAPLGWVHPDDPRAARLRAELVDGCKH